MLTVDEFFAIATQEEDWHDQDERETAKRFQNLVSILKQNLSQLQVYRVGSIDIDAYIVGVTDGGEWAGLSTDYFKFSTKFPRLGFTESPKFSPSLQANRSGKLAIFDQAQDI
jgi:predicted peptidase